MRFISFAQNFEDVMLWRALRCVERGFYIDVGAWLPDQDSVTKAFYDRGWNGINVEPSAGVYAQLAAARSRDVNLQLAVSDREGHPELYVIRSATGAGSSGLSTLDETVVAAHIANGYVVSERLPVVSRSLASICQDHVGADTEIHFLKIDVEGAEAAAIRGADWRRYRPWIVVVEATGPNTQNETHMSWEPLLLDAGYALVYCDGLNRFYVAKERAELNAAFSYPPNVFDNFIRFSEDHANARADAAATQVAALRADNDALETKAAALQTTAEGLRKSLTTMQESLSWRITLPLRSIAAAVLRFGQSLRGLAGRWAQSFGGVRNFIAPYAGSALRPRPRMAKVSPKDGAEACADESDLTPRARWIHRALVRAIARRQPG